LSSLPPSTWGNRLRARNAGKLNVIDKSRRPLMDIEMDLIKTEKQFAIIKIERDSK
jgi:hypothetical protein